jgi:hypothetical protein
MVGNGTGGFTETDEWDDFSWGGPDPDLAVGDFDEDGISDVAITYYDGANGTTRVLTGNGDGTLTDGAYLDLSAGGILVADLNGDGHQDVATATGTATGEGVSYVLGDGNGNFGGRTTYATDLFGALAVAAADINDDGVLDLVSAGGSTSVLLGNGAGGFMAAGSFAADLSAGRLAVGSFNQDDFADVAVIEWIGGSPSFVAVHLNAADWLTSPLITVSDGSVTEGNSGTVSAVFTVTLSSPSLQPVSVTYATRNSWSPEGPAQAGSDYVYTTGTVTFAPGETSKQVMVNVLGDLEVEGNETFLLVLHNPVGGLVADDRGIGTILNDDYSLRINDYGVTEGHTGTVTATFTVTRSGAPNGSSSVQFATGPTAFNPATADSDYQSTSGTVSFAAGETSKTISVVVFGDRIGEANEGYVVNLSNPTNATISDGQGVGSIVDDEPRISINDVTKVEGRQGQTTLFVFTVSLSAAYDQPVSVSFRTLDGAGTTGAKAKEDYIAQTGTLTFAAGETTKTITIQVKGDNKKENNETFYLDLFGNSDNSLFTKWRGLGTILNDD